MKVRAWEWTTTASIKGSTGRDLREPKDVMAEWWREVMVEQTVRPNVLWEGGEGELQRVIRESRTSW